MVEHINKQCSNVIGSHPVIQNVGRETWLGPHEVAWQSEFIQMPLLDTLAMNQERSL